MDIFYFSREQIKSLYAIQRSIKSGRCYLSYDPATPVVAKVYIRDLNETLALFQVIVFKTNVHKAIQETQLPTSLYFPKDTSKLIRFDLSESGIHTTMVVDGDMDPSVSWGAQTTPDNLSLFIEKHNHQNTNVYHTSHDMTNIETLASVRLSSNKFKNIIAALSSDDVYVIVENNKMIWRVVKLGGTVNTQEYQQGLLYTGPAIKFMFSGSSLLYLKNVFIFPNIDDDKPFTEIDMEICRLRGKDTHLILIHPAKRGTFVVSDTHIPYRDIGTVFINEICSS